MFVFSSAVDGKKVKMEQEVKRYGYTHALSALEQRDKKRNDARKRKAKMKRRERCKSTKTMQKRREKMPEVKQIVDQKENNHALNQVWKYSQFFALTGPPSSQRLNTGHLPQGA